MLNKLYERIESEVMSLAMRNKLYDELDMAERAGIDTEEGKYHIRRVINTLDTL